MAEDFEKAVEDGLRLSKRLYFGKDRAVAPPKPLPAMEKPGTHSCLPTAPMVYAVICDPAMVDNPDIPSYQPHVHGRCDPPALIPLQMHGVELEVDCYLDMALVRVVGSWRLHCVMGSRSCGCRVAIPMGEQGSILGVEVEVSRKSHCTQLIKLEDNKDVEKASSADGGFLNSNIFTMTVPQIDGGSILSISMSWSQKLVYSDGQFTLNVPFTFPEYVTPVVKKISKKEKIQLNVNAGTGTEVLCKTVSHPLKEVRRHAGKLGFFYESEIYSWSSMDFSFSYAVSSRDIHGAVFLQSPSVHAFDQREMFCLYLFPGNQQSRKVFRKEIVFVVDISGSMRGKPLDDTRNVLSEALSKLDPEDSFSIIAFNGEIYLFSTSMEVATKETVERAIEWMSLNFIAGGGTNILLPLNKALEMLTNARGSTPIIFLVTDGAVEDERRICDVMNNHIAEMGSKCPRIYTFGIGSFCNHYFLRMLAMISRGQYDAAYDADMVEARLQKLFTRASSLVLSNVTFDTLDTLDEVEVFPAQIPDLSSEGPLIVSGRYRGDFPKTFKAKGVLADLNSSVIDLKKHTAKDVPLDRILAKEQIEQLTAQAWFSENKQLEDKIVKISIQTGVISEYTSMIVLETIGKKVQDGLQEVAKKGRPQKMADSENQKVIPLQSMCVGFGNLTATGDNIPPGCEEPKLPEAAEMIVKAASSCCGNSFKHCCCMCCIQCCSRMNDQCAILLAQICTGLACFGCLDCCVSLCCSDSDGR
ncbi:von Willebrand factor, type A [Parasponia andersonii]|uniref:von Willebrand factor, type A n=1 Tax=Parasponia andersonii TaxID=3476 RepID=A0A2P5CY86_PARAD|nr:von Willebrand factor, type A [Parasponia andersonii]